ncbi:MAG: 3'-5' exonuclease [Cyclobacteriaceae bacterium]|nr:3'-5' exonuclease [Cyclobacteriaceae bacterium]
MQVAGLLLKSGVNAKLIQTNDGFSLFNLLEVRYFWGHLNMTEDVFTISDDIWENAKRDLISRFSGSSRLEICANIIRDFEATNPKRKFKSDLEVFIRESRLEDFIAGNGETIIVSTIHKAKGKEFDNVFIMLDNYNQGTDEGKRQLYVAMTRAKQKLTIHLNSTFLDTISVENMERIHDPDIHLPPNELVMHLTFKDVWLDYFIHKQPLLSSLTSGDELVISGYDCLTATGKPVLKFSQTFQKQLDELKSKNFELTRAKVNFIIYWLKEGAEQEVKIILPELHFQRNDPQQEE